MAQTAKPDTLRSDTVNVWIPTIVTALNLSQLAFNNWTQGCSNSLSWTLAGNVGYEYKGEEWGLNNHIRAAYGRTRLGSQNSITTENEFFWIMFSYMKPDGWWCRSSATRLLQH
jgi:hypothetical protein